MNYEFNRSSTIEMVTDLLAEHLPRATADNSSFLRINKEFVDQICKKKDTSAAISKYCLEQCPKCSAKLVKWPHKTKESYMISLGDIKKVRINVNQCPECNILLYPSLFNVGLIPLHNKE